jgi:hypothetical protein
MYSTYSAGLGDGGFFTVARAVRDLGARLSLSVAATEDAPCVQRCSREHVQERSSEKGYRAEIFPFLPARGEEGIGRVGALRGMAPPPVVSSRSCCLLLVGARTRLAARPRWRWLCAMVNGD